MFQVLFLFSCFYYVKLVKVISRGVAKGGYGGVVTMDGDVPEMISGLPVPGPHVPRPRAPHYYYKYFITYLFLAECSDSGTKQGLCPFWKEGLNWCEKRAHLMRYYCAFTCNMCEEKNGKRKDAFSLME